VLPVRRASAAPVRLTLLACLCWVRTAEITDCLVDLLIGLVHKINARAERRVEGELIDDLKRVRGKEGILFRIAEAAVAEPEGTVRKVVFPVAGEATLQDLVREAKANKQTFRHRVRTVLASSYSAYYRRMLPSLLGALDFRSNSTCIAGKRIAVAEMKRANQTVLPMLRLDSLVVVAGEFVEAPLFVANDGAALDDVEIEARFANTSPPAGLSELLNLDTSALASEVVTARFSESAWAILMPRLEAHRAVPAGRVVVAAPHVPGSHDLVLRLRAGGGAVAENRYTLHVVAPPAASLPVQVLGDTAVDSQALERVLASPGQSGPTIVGEGCLDDRTAKEVALRLDHGEVVVVLAQSVEAAEHYPVPVTLHPVETEWGSSVFHFTTDHGALPSLPRRNVLVAEDSTIQARCVVARIDGAPFPDTPVVIAYKPVPGAMAGAVVGSHEVGKGRLIFCQYRLCNRAAGGDGAARALLADLVRWAALPRRRLEVEESRLADGRRVARYSHTTAVAR